MRNPCQGCQERHTLCHAECDKHLAWKAEREEAKERHYKELHATDFLMKNAIKAKKKSRRR